MKLARDGTMPVDYQHSKTGITLPAAAAIHGKVDVVKSAIVFGANPTFQVFFYSMFQLMIRKLLIVCYKKLKNKIDQLIKTGQEFE